jgi:hypothetical protein
MAPVWHVVGRFVRSLAGCLYGAVVGLLVYGSVGGLGGLALGLVMYLADGFGYPADRSKGLVLCPVIGLVFSGLAGVTRGAIAGATLGLERWPTPPAIIRATWGGFASSVKGGSWG